LGLRDVFGRIKAVNPKAELRRPKEIRNPKADRTARNGHVVAAGRRPRRWSGAAGPSHDLVLACSDKRYESGRGQPHSPKPCGRSHVPKNAVASWSAAVLSHPYLEISLLNLRQQIWKASPLWAWSPPFHIRYEPTGALSRRDKLTIAQCFSIGNALRRIDRVPEGRLIWSQAPLTGAGLSRPFGT
jgi:hypothetical protein